MRKFYLMNENGERFDLQSMREGGYLTNPSGLGYENGITYVKIGNAYQEESRELKQGFVTGTATLESYDRYFEFVDFVENSKDLKLIYAPIDIEYYRDVDFDSISKGEKTGHWVQCSLKLNCKSLYYTEDNQEFVVDVVEGEARYPLRYPFRYVDHERIFFDFLNNGHTDAAILAEMHGFIVNPCLELSVDGVLKSKMIFNITVESGQKLLYSAQDNKNYVMLEDVDGNQTKVADCLAIENNNFFRIPRGVSSLKLTSDTGTTNKNIFRILTYRKGV